ncbi:MAG: hypothetical protein QOE92_2257, partial [Chloroflexota bacterium]|nr:hypothetical protein [Chloroflexota bacterium]
MKRLISIAGMLALVTSFLAWVPAAAAPPLSCVVNSTDDDAWASGDNCETATAGEVTLRSAIEALNAAAAGTHTITFNLPDPSVITLQNGALNVTSGTLHITGPGARRLAVDGDAASTVFAFDGGTTVVMSGITVQNGATDGDGGGILSSGTVVLDRVAILGNQASGGGGINIQCCAEIPLTITNSIIAGNTAGSAAAIDIEGDDTGESTLTNVTITNNTGEEGAVEIAATTMHLEFVTLASNHLPDPDGQDLPDSPAGLGVHDDGTATVHS